MEKIQENICKQACSYVFVQESYIKALMYFLHLVLTFTPHYIVMVKGLLRPGRDTHHPIESIPLCFFVVHP